MKKLTILYMTLQSGILLDHSTDTFHVAESRGNYPASSYLYLCAGFGATDHSLLPKQVLSLALKTPYYPGFPSSSLAAYFLVELIPSSRPQDIKISKKNRLELSFLSTFYPRLYPTQHFKFIFVLITAKFIF